MSLLKNKRVLIIEDDDILREVILEEFETCECLVTTAVSGNQALRAIQNDPTPFDLIVTDIQMSDGNGASFLDNLKKMNLVYRPYIIMVSGYTDLPTDELNKRGADLILSKPFELNELIEFSIKLLSKDKTG